MGCDELGDNDVMQAYVEEMGGTSLCAALTGDGCDKKSKDYVAKVRAKVKDQGVGHLESQITRLQKMESEGGSMTGDALKWVKTRMSLLKQLSAKKDEL